MSAPRTKRQFAGAASDASQRHITSFFNKSPSCPNVTTSSVSSPATISSPDLPASVQSNLLSVGMRVRKSVPEGYKTGSAYSGFSLWADAAASSHHNNNGGTPLSVAPRELLPFCGIHKVGGLSAQPDFDAAPPLPVDVFTNPLPALDDVPGLTSSQESVESNVPTICIPPAPLSAGPGVGATRKRGFSEDEDDAGSDAPSLSDRLRVRRGDWLDGEVSPRSLVPAGWENARVMAEPRRRMAGQLQKRAAGGVGPGGSGAAGEGLALASLGQENMAADDFDEAEFLDFRWAAGDDLDMGGM
ncbi:hypothetical protein NKR23_g1893 [Pleurostoma richardsiae]|uniref:Uncharacterized protein n=1 Tax=Pleurostoma richardsiae TaxID=41990 RepID=A0AA38S3J3_9PEZI|nr:hypothetical protein NKR23_g1893 [Pleurostoma richardsiae]